MKPAIRRCAIYTRKSSEEGLDQAFNSLHAQREACEAYVKSQVSEGWRASKEAFDDGGISGGTMERPALKQLLAEVAAGRVDVVVVYKVDRLTRSLADFAKMVELFDAHGVSFVSVTQAFNTTTSMGRLTLNVLLSFAQFEREVTGERIRDKLAASKAKGMWMGGLPPLGYAPDPAPGARSLVIVPEEAERVRRLFCRYLELGSVNALRRELDAEGGRSKVWVTRQGRRLGGLPFSRGGLFHLLSNPIFVGDIRHKDQTHRGLHPPILEREVFDAVQAHLRTQAGVRRRRPIRAMTAPLKSLLFDALSRPMSPTFTRASGRERINRYYVSAPVQQGRRSAAGDDIVARVPGGVVEDFVLGRLRLLHREGGPDAGWDELKPALRRVEVSYDRMVLEIAAAAVLSEGADLEDERARVARKLSPDDRLQTKPSDPTTLQLFTAVRLKRRGGRTQLSLPDGSDHLAQRLRPDRALISALRRAHQLKREHNLRLDGAPPKALPTTPEARYARRLLAMAFLAPDLQADILAGRQPAGLTLQQLILHPTPLAWIDQRAHLTRLAAAA